ncbi:autotransporter outer membrane beta-barrel domain-containing protein [Bradyrhizobium sp. S3.12.5]|uniref:autotransporter outer membrane beta-barrel domain-containing protein n=1 Tax=Bradyrhizobium sp. S3.12.5 TaxID=3156386 RepID=UPI0033968479
MALGLAATSAAWFNGAAAQESIANGSFETGCVLAFPVCPPWAFTGNASVTFLRHSGAFSGIVNFGGGSGTISQNVSLSRAGVYQFSFWYATFNAGTVTLNASVGGQNVFNQSLGIGVPYTQSSALITLSSGSQNVLFSATSTSGTEAATIDDVSLTFLRSLFLSPLLSSDAPTNPTNVAAAIDRFIDSGATLPAGFVNLFSLTPQQLSLALTQASGEVATGTQQTTFNAMGQFMGVMSDPFMAGRNDMTNASGAAGYADENARSYAAKRGPNDALAAIYTRAQPRVAPFESRWSTWVAGYGGSQTTDGNTITGSSGTTSRVFGAAVGADYRFSPFTIAGFSLAGGGTNFSVNGAGSGHSDLFQAGAFIRHSSGAAYITAALAYGWQDITTNRTVTIAGVDRLQARFDANAYSGRVEGGYRIVSPWTGGIGVTPYAAGQFTTFDLPAYAESALSSANTFALAYGSQSVTDTRSELGLRTDKSYALTEAILTLRGRAAWAHDYNPNRNLTATFQTLPGASFVVNGAAQASDSALVTASAELKRINGWSATATFEGEFSDVTRSYAGKGVVRYQW